MSISPSGASIGFKVTNCLRYLAVKEFMGEPDAGNLQVRFHEGGGGNSSPTPPSPRPRFQALYLVIPIRWV